MSYSVVNVEDIEGAGPGGAVRFVRRELGAEAFGINWFELPPNAEGNEHDETTLGQEEVSVVVHGDGHWRIDGEEVPCPGRQLRPLRSRGHPLPGCRSRRHDVRVGRVPARLVRASRPVLADLAGASGARRSVMYVLFGLSR